MTQTFLTSRLPLVAAPMAGGATTVALAGAAADAGAFPFLAAGYKAPEALRDEVAALRGRTGDFGVNLFVPGRGGVDAAGFAAYAAAISDELGAYGLRLSQVPAEDDDAWGAKLQVLREDPVPVVSLTFGLPPTSDIALLKRAGSAVVATVTTPTKPAPPRKPALTRSSCRARQRAATPRLGTHSEGSPTARPLTRSPR